MDTQFGANGVATFLLLSRPINFSPIPIASAVSNIQFGFPHGRRTALSTGILATGLGLSAAYAGISLGGYWHEQSITSTVPVQWMGKIFHSFFPPLAYITCHTEHPADYVPPVMDLFTEDRVPLGYSNASPDVCRKDLEHLERAFDLLKYQYLFKTYGVPLDNQDLLLVRPLRILGNTSSGSAAEVFSAMTPLPYFILSTNGGDSADFSSSKFTYIMTMAAVFGLVATFLSRESAVKASAIAEPSWEEHKHDGNCTFTPPKEVVGILMNPEQSIEQLFEEDPFTDTYTPYVVLTFHDDDSYAYSNVQWREDDSAPDGFAARFDAPQDALASLKELRNITEGFLFNLLRFIVLGSAIIVCFALHVMVFLVKGRFGRRGIKQLMKRFKKAKSSKTVCHIFISGYTCAHCCDQNLTLAVEKDDTEARHQTIEMSGQGIETFSLPERSDSNDIKQSNEIIKPPMEHDTQPAPECGTNASVAIPKAEEMVASEAEPCSLSDPVGVIISAALRVLIFIAVQI